MGLAIPCSKISSYTSGSGKITGIARTAGGSLAMGHDGLGRRTFDYDSLDPVRSRRDYTYLPNGQ
ncbi:MAG: hypothetical protein KBG15_07505, partial [Kofleriaceae bacterium]|nr:hypothetical protein [Kofleriaceae bacterium]